MFHTIELSYQVTNNEFQIYNKMLCDYSEDYRREYYKEKNNYETKKCNIYVFSIFNDIGINLKLQNIHTENFTYYGISIRLNPKRLINKNEYIEITKDDELKIITEKFNSFMAKIDDKFPKLEAFKVKRIDYCFNYKFEDKELAKKYINLLTRAYIPNGFKEDMYYSMVSKRKVKYKDCLRCKNGSVVINFYNKYEQLLKNKAIECNKKKVEGIVRFEIQCKYKKVYNIMKKYNLKENGCINFLSDYISRDILCYYLNKIFGTGDYHTLDNAKNLIEESNYNERYKKIMCGFIYLVSEKRSITKAVNHLLIEKKYKIGNINKIIKTLNDLNINPVTIPINWNIKSFPNPIKFIL